MRIWQVILHWARAFWATVFKSRVKQQEVVPLKAVAKRPGTASMPLAKFLHSLVSKPRKKNLAMEFLRKFGILPSARSLRAGRELTRMRKARQAQRLYYKSLCCARADQARRKRLIHLSEVRQTLPAEER